MYIPFKGNIYTTNILERERERYMPTREKQIYIHICKRKTGIHTYTSKYTNIHTNVKKIATTLSTVNK